jgi:hypothetical protein
MPAFSQSSDLSAYIHEKHGFDQKLINGIIYYDKYKHVLNHPYHSREESLPGWVVISGTCYDDVQINYNIYSQQLILEYPDVSGSFYKIILSPAHTDEFQLDGDYFKRISLDEQGPLFYQVIRVNDLICYIHYEKQMLTMSNHLGFSYYFSGTKRSYFLDFYGNLFPFTNRRTFVSLISSVSKKEMKKYMRRNEIKLSDAKPEQLEGLLKFISSIVQSTSGN